MKHTFIAALFFFAAAGPAFACMYDPTLFTRFYDTDGNGFVMQEEMMAVFEKDAAIRDRHYRETAEEFARRGQRYRMPKFPTPQEQWDKDWAPMDMNGDGKVSFGEYDTYKRSQMSGNCR